ncbi:Sulfite reductase (ferredoxin) [Segniliparus rotundus DSM 44985]|uniref:assimilatory sulfite reductase (ferredoxin) n=1 Tax=Segniliparus rotundus (strain ATCC BAA-972 / CDC 1076 / CIP 108378 / DSM 44985 / JCM 13578) TaxID=640132 RepID=D6Z7B2_SEGRD|nr:Sulfite reductase (ferredoxin) [Segniliparus rotundus DSM 44985]
MSEMSEVPSPARPARPQKTRDEGQWKVSGQTPLNDNERIKQEAAPLGVRERIEQIYAKEGFDSISKEDLRGRFRWWGLYTQREQGYDGTYTGDDNTDLLEAKFFMLRIRSDGGALNLEQLRTIAALSVEFGRDTADLSDRENVQLHWIRVEDMPEIWRRLAAVGLDTTEACGDCPRVILGSPLAGVAEDEVIDPSWAIQEIKRRYIGKPEYQNLPRKFKTAITGLMDVPHEVQDVAFVGVDHPEHGPGFDLWVGGGLSTNPILGQRVGAWVPEAEVPDVWEGVVSVFRDYGYRRMRAKARLKFLVKDWGVEKFRQVLEEEYLGRALVDGPAPPQVPTRDHVGVTRQKDGRNAVGFAPIAGRVSGSVLAKAAEAVERAGSDKVRFTPYQKFIVLDVPDEHVEALIGELEPLGLKARPSVWRRNLMACSGIEFCKLSFAETRKRSQALVPELESRLGHLEDQIDSPITININGCPNSCARSQIADIGFKGQMVNDDESDAPVEGFQAHLGGSLGFGPDFGRKLRQHKVTTHELGDYIERVVTNYLTNRAEGERFAEWARRAEEQELR